VATRAVNMSVSLTDAWGLTSQALAYAVVDDTHTVASLILDLNAFVTNVDGASDAVPQRAHLSLVPALPGGVKTQVPTAYIPARVTEVGEISFSVSGSARKYTFVLPAVSNATTVKNGKNLITLSGALATFIATALGAGSAITSYASADARALSAYRNAFIGDRSKRKQQKAATNES